MLLIVIGVAVALLVGFVAMYNKLVGMRRLTDNAWADVDVYLKRRAELVPNLVAAVKGAAQYEQGTLERVVEARSQALSLSGPSTAKSVAEQELRSGIVRTVALAENYPALQANANFLKLQSELSDVERQIASARQYYNACVRDYNILLESFPSSVVAQSSGMKVREFFEVEDMTERKAPTVQGV